MLFALSPHDRRPRLRAVAATYKAARGGQNRRFVPAFGNFGIEGATDLARKNLIVAIALNPPAVRTVVHGAIVGFVHGGHVVSLLIRSPRPRAAGSTAVSQGRAPWRSCGSRPSRIWSETAPEDRPASR